MQAPPPTQAPSPQVAREAKPEMWFITLAKSKTMRFFAVSCEFVIFLGCLWLTLVTIIPSATSWLWGGIDHFFLVAMGFAVDAALPEAWLHVVDQYTTTPKKRSQLRWSIPIAIGMLLLVVANFAYTKLAGDSGTQPTGASAALVNMLLIARMFIGICYVTIRECQSFLDRKQHRQAQQRQSDLAELQEQAQQQATQLTDLAARLAEIQAALPTLDQTAIAQLVLTSLEARFTQEMKRARAEWNQQASVSRSGETPQWNGTSRQSETEPLGQVKLNHTAREELHALKRNHGPSEKIVPLPQRPASPPDPAQEYPQRREAQAEEREALILRAWREDPRRSDDAIAALTGISKTTVWRKLKPYRDQARAREGLEPSAPNQGQAVQGTLELSVSETAEPAS